MTARSIDPSASSDPVFEGVYGPFTITAVDRREVLGYRLALLTLAVAELALLWQWHRFGAVVGRLVAGEAAAVHPVIDGSLQALPPGVDALRLIGRFQVGHPVGRWPAVEQLDQPRAFIHHNAALGAVVEHRHRGRRGRWSPAAAVEVGQGLGPFKRRAELPAAGAGVWLHYHQIDR